MWSTLAAWEIDNTYTFDINGTITLCTNTPVNEWSVASVVFGTWWTVDDIIAACHKNNSIVVLTWNTAQFWLWESSSIMGGKVWTIIYFFLWLAIIWIVLTTLYKFIPRKK